MKLCDCDWMDMAAIARVISRSCLLEVLACSWA